MRIRGRIIVAVLALPLLAGTAACGELQEAQEGVDQAQKDVSRVQDKVGTAQECGKLLGVVNYMPDFSNPQQAREQARQKANELDKLASQTGDQQLAEATREVQRSLERVAAGEVTAESSTKWVQTKLERTQRVLAICSGTPS